MFDKSLDDIKFITQTNLSSWASGACFGFMAWFAKEAANGGLCNYGCDLNITDHCLNNDIISYDLTSCNYEKAVVAACALGIIGATFSTGALLLSGLSYYYDDKIFTLASQTTSNSSIELDDLESGLRKKRGPYQQFK